MLMTKRFLLSAVILLSVCFYFGPQPEVRAFDPVTLAILTPLAIQGAKILAPYVMRAMGNMLTVMVRAGKHLIGFLRLPLGLLQCTFLAPWCFSSGLANLGAGLLAPVKFVGNVLLLPVSIFGIGV